MIFFSWQEYLKEQSSLSAEAVRMIADVLNEQGLLFTALTEMIIEQKEINDNNTWDPTSHTANYTKWESLYLHSKVNIYKKELKQSKVVHFFVDDTLFHIVVTVLFSRLSVQQSVISIIWSKRHLGKVTKGLQGFVPVPVKLLPSYPQRKLYKIILYLNLSLKSEQSQWLCDWAFLDSNISAQYLL